MTVPLSTLVGNVEASAQTLSLVNYDGPNAEKSRIVSYFEPQNVHVEEDVTALSLPRNFAVLHDGEAFVAAAGTDEIHRHLAGAAYLGPDALGSADRPAILRHVDDRTFTSYDRRRMTLASREIESYAFRAGGGELHAGFQRLSLLAPQTRIYERIADAGVETHVYGVPDAAVPGGLIEHHSEDREVRDSWFVAYRGDEPSDARALVAVETDPGAFTGFWTFETETVETVLERLGAEHPAGNEAGAPADD